MTLSMNNVLVDVGSTICQDSPQYEQCIGRCWKYFICQDDPQYEQCIGGCWKYYMSG